MGSGTYYAVGFGCPSIGCEVSDALQEVFDKYNVSTSYEGTSDYAVIELLSTLDRAEMLPGVAPLEELATAIQAAIGKKAIAAATKKWKRVQAAADALAEPVGLPNGRLLWLSDYD